MKVVFVDCMIHLKHIHKHYTQGETEVKVLSDVSLEIRPGKRLAIIGPSGSGKTTLLSIMAGLETPSNGTVLFGDRSFFSLPEAEKNALRRKEMGFIFQNFELFESFTAFENVLLPLEILGAPDPKLVDTMLEKVGIRHRANAYPSQLSGGEQQRVAIARALIHEPSFLFADEPTGNLDEENAENILALLFDQLQSDQTLCIITHDTKIADRCDEQWKLQHRTLVQQP